MKRQMWCVCCTYSSLIYVNQPRQTASNLQNTTTGDMDTGASVSVISITTQAKYFPKGILDNTSAILTTYTGDQIPVVGVMKVEVSYGEQMTKLSLYVVEGQGPCLMGRDWIRSIRLD